MLCYMEWLPLPGVLSPSMKCRELFARGVQPDEVMRDNVEQVPPMILTPCPYDPINVGQVPPMILTPCPYDPINVEQVPPKEEKERGQSITHCIKQKWRKSGFEIQSEGGI